MGRHRSGGRITLVGKPVANKRNRRGLKLKSEPTISIPKKEYEKLKRYEKRHVNNIQFGGPTYCTIVDNGAQQSLVGNKDWIISKRHNDRVAVSGAIGNTVDVLNVVDAYTTLVDEAGRGLAILWLNQCLHCPESSQTLLAEDQLECNGVEVHSRAKVFNGRQCIYARHPTKRGRFTIKLGWDKASKFVLTRKPKKGEYKALPHVHLTGTLAYLPGDTCTELKSRRLVTARNRSFPWTRPQGRKFQWTPHVLAEWRARLNFADPTRVKKTFAATTQLYPSIPQENSLLPRQPTKERLPGLGAPYRQIRRNGETFSADIVYYKHRGKVRYLLVFSGVISRFSAVYDLGFSKASASTSLALQQFIADHGIPECIITDEDHSETQSKQWIDLCAKFIIQTRNSEPYCQNQNPVERFIQTAARAVSRIKQETGVGNAYEFELWSHVSDIENHLAKRCLKWRTPLECFTGETPDLSVFRHRWYAPVWYKEKTAATGQVKLFPGRYMGLAWNVGDTLCAKILTCPDKGRPQIIHRGIYFARTPGESALPHLLEYPKDKLWPKLDVDPMVPRAPIAGSDPDNSQGAEIVHSEDRGHNNPPKAKKLKLTVDGTKPTANLTENNEVAANRGQSGRGNDGKNTQTKVRVEFDSRDTTEYSDNESFSAGSNSSSDSGNSLDGKSMDSDSSDDDSVASNNVELNPPESSQSSNGMSKEDSDKRWTTMHKEDVQGMLNETAGFENHYEILKHFWSRQGELKFRVYDRYNGVEITCSARDLQLDSPHNLATYIKNKRLWSTPNGKTWAKWADNHFTQVKRVFRRLEKVFGITSFDSVQQAGRPLSEQPALAKQYPNVRMRRVAKKPSGRNRRNNPAMGSVKYGVKIPKNVKEALMIDKFNKDDLWKEAIIKEISALMGRQTFEYLSGTWKKRQQEGYKFAPLRMIFDIKQDGRRKARLVIGGHVLDSENMDTYASVMKAISARLLMVIASNNNYEVMVGDIKNAYLYADCDIKVCTRVGPEFVEAGYKELPEGSLARVVRALYGLPTSGRNWRYHLADTLRGMGFTPTRYDNDVWMRARRDKDGMLIGYDYMGCHTDDLMIVAENAQSIMDQLTAVYEVAKPGPPSYHLGCNYSKETVEGKDYWFVSSETHTREAIVKAKEILDKLSAGSGKGWKIKYYSRKSEKTPIPESLHPELDESELLDEEHHNAYQRLIGILQWLCSIGRADIQFAVCSLNRFNAAPRKNQLKAVVRIFSYLQEFLVRKIKMDHRDFDLFKDLEEPDDEFKRLYPDAFEELDPKQPEPYGNPLLTGVFFDSDHAHDKVTNRSCTGLVIYVGSTPVMWSSKRQSSIASSSYAAEFLAGRQACEEAIAIRYMLRSLGCRIKGRTVLYGDNQGMLTSSTKIDAECKKKHVQISYNIMRECVAAGVTNPVKIDTKCNLADFLTKGLGWESHHFHTGTFFGRWSPLEEVDMQQVKL